jgi:hypothetical protein
MFMSGLKEADRRSSTHLLLKPVKNQSAWRPVLGVLNILQVGWLSSLGWLNRLLCSLNGQDGWRLAGPDRSPLFLPLISNARD